MDQLLLNKSMPPGFRFHPTDEELFMFYLKRKVMGRSLRPEMIAELDIYKFGPWDLPHKSALKTRDLTWYFFCPRSHKYSHGARTNRSTEGGYWKSTGNDRTVQYNHRSVGKVKTLIFHLGKAPKGERTDWVMHEYRLEDKDLADKGVPQDSYVICKVYKKSGLGPKNGEQYGAPFVEEGESDDDENKGIDPEHVWNHGGEYAVPNDQGGSVITSALHTYNSAAVFSPSVEEQMTPASAFIPSTEEQMTSASASIPSSEEQITPAFALIPYAEEQMTPASAFIPSVEEQPMTPAVDAQDALRAATPTTSVVQPTPAVEAGVDPINNMDEDDMDALLAIFTVPDTDIYYGLDDLEGFDWTQLLAD